MKRIEQPKTTERGYASYRGLMSDGAPIEECAECEKAGRSNVPMTYCGITLSDQPFNFGDYWTRVPFDVWKCRYGHEYRDGY